MQQDSVLALRRVVHSTSHLQAQAQQQQQAQAQQQRYDTNSKV
jgi:hypothetical protein